MVRLILMIIFIALTSTILSCTNPTNPNALIMSANEISLDQPNYQVSDSWTYDKHYPISCLTWKVEPYNSSEIMKLKCDNNELHYSVHDSFNLVKAISADGEIAYTADPYWPHLSFPLHVGKCWDLSWRATDPTLEWLWAAYTRACVVSYEKVKVPAGTFDAMRIEYLRDASVAFAFVSFALMARRRRALWLAAALALGSVIGGMRVGLGAHFLSDTMFAGVISVSMAAALFWLFFERPLAARSPPPEAA